MILEVLNVITPVISGLLLFKYWYVGKGYAGFRKLCYLQIAISTLQFLYNGLLLKLHPELWTTLLFQPLIVWAVLMSIKGLYETKDRK